LGDLDAIDWSRASMDSTSVRAKRGGQHTGPSPTDRGKRGSKYRLLVDRRGVPLVVQVIGPAPDHLSRWSGQVEP
jgi:hypothetical protein